jgi:SNF2 family DNA or RNA helicase
MRLAGGTPVFYVDSDVTTWGRVYGASHDKKAHKWYFPAFHPFLPRVLHDFEVTVPGVRFSSEAHRWAEASKEEPGTPQIEGNFKHQNEGLRDLILNYRYILNWEMGTGKSKVLIDLLFCLRELTLILCPLVGAKNWRKEFRKHTGTSLTCLPIIHDERSGKLEGLREAHEYDAIAVPYDTARLYGVPILHLEARKLLPGHFISIPKADLDLVRQVNDPETQVRFVKELHAGRTRADLRQEIVELTKEKQWLCQIPFKIIAADESHRIKHLESLRTKVCMRLAAQATRRYLFTGTLSQGDPRDLYPQLKFLAPYLIPEDYEAYKRKYVCYSAYNRHVVTGFKNLHILNAVVAGVSSEKKLKDCKDMPTQTIVPVLVDLYPEQIALYNYAVKNNGIETPDGDYAFPNGAVRISKLLEVCSGFFYCPPPKSVCDTCSSKIPCIEDNIEPGSPRCRRKNELPKRTILTGMNAKKDALSDLLDDILEDPTHKTVIWAYYDEELNIIERLLKKKKLTYIRVDGSNSQHAVELAEKFSDGPFRVYLGQISTGIAIDLVAAKYMVYYSRSWKLDDWDQSLRRNYRIIQTENTTVYVLITQKTVEESQMAALELRQDIAAMLTEKVKCLECTNYKACQERGIKPWDDGCKMETMVPRLVTKAKEIK